MNPQILISWIVKRLQDDAKLLKLESNPVEVTAEFNVLPRDCKRASLISIRLGQIVTSDDSIYCPRRRLFVRFVIMCPRTQPRANQKDNDSLGAHTQLYQIFTELDRIVRDIQPGQLPTGWEIARGFLDTGPIAVFQSPSGNLGLEMVATVPFDFLQAGG